MDRSRGSSGAKQLAMSNAEDRAKRSSRTAFKAGAPRRTRLPAALLATTALLGAALPASAQTVWTGAASDDWDTAANWNTNAVPTAGDNVIVNDVAANIPRIGAGVSASVFDLRLGAAGGDGSLIIGDGGDLVTSFGSVGAETGLSGRVTVDGTGSTWVNGATFHVGEDGSGILELSNGGQAEIVGDAIVGGSPDAVGTVTVDGLGSRWFNDATLFVGDSGSGGLAITNGGAVAAVDAFIGNNDGSFGSVTVDGFSSDPSILFVDNAVVVGNSGNGVLAITNGGAVEAVDAFIGNNAGSFGSVTVDGFSSDPSILLVDNAAVVGNSGNGVLTVSNLGAVQAIGGTLDIALNPGSSGTLNIGAAVGQAPAAAGIILASDIRFGVGEGKIVFNHADLNHSFFPAITGTGSVEVHSGTTVLFGASTYTGGTTIFGGTLRLGQTDVLADDGDVVVESGGSLVVDGVSETLAGLSVDGTLDVVNGGILTTTGPTALGFSAGAHGTALVSGAGSELNVGTTLFFVGRAGQGTLTITEDATVNAVSVVLGEDAAAAGSVIVQGAGSRLLTANIQVGAAGQGSLSILDNAEASASNVLIGTGSGASGAVVVQGGAALRTNTLFVGNSGEGSLTLVDGAEVVIAGGGGTMNIASNAGSAGVLNIGAAAGGPAQDPGFVVAEQANFGGGDGRIVFNHTSGGYDFDPVVGGDGVVELHAGATVFNRQNSYTGGTIVFDGAVLQWGNVDVLSDQGDVTVESGGRLDLNGFTETINALHGAGEVELAGASAQLSVAEGVFTGIISGAGGLTKVDTGTLILGGDNSYAGGTSVLGGTLIGDTTSLKGDILTNASLVFDQAFDGTYGGALSGSGSLTKAGVGTLSLTGPNSHTGGTHIQAGILEGDTSSLVGDFTNDGALVFNQSANGTFSGAVSGTGTLHKRGSAILTLTGANSHTGGTFVEAGILETGAAEVMPDAGRLTVDRSATFRLSGFTETVQDVRVDGSLNVLDGAQLTTRSFLSIGQSIGQPVVQVVGTGSTLVVGTDLIVGDNGSGVLRLVDGGRIVATQSLELGSAAGTVGFVLTNDAAATIEAGSVLIGNLGAASLDLFNGASLTVDGGAGTIEIARGADSTGDLTIGGLSGGNLTAPGVVEAGAILFGDGDGRIVFNHNAVSTFAPSISGNGTVAVRAGTTILTGTNSYSGGTSIAGGTLIGDTNSLTGDIANDAALVFDQPFDGTFGGEVSGSGILHKQGVGRLILAGATSPAGGIVVDAGTLQGDATSLQANIVNNATLVFDQAADGLFSGTIGGDGDLTKTGAGALTLTAADIAFGGSTTISEGELVVEGGLSSLGGILVDGGTLAGTGTIASDVAVTAGTLAPGNSPGTLTIGGDLVLAAGSTLAFELGDPGGTPGLDSDLIQVGGNLTLDGLLNVADAGGFGAGVYRLIDYGGSLTDEGLVVGTAPDGNVYDVQIATAGQVNLLVATAAAPPDSFDFWDGANTTANDAIDGGTGDWTATSTNWTDVTGAFNGAFDPAALLVFAGSPGTVTIDNGAGAVTAESLQFAVDGYTVAGGDLTLTGSGTVRVGDGTSAGADFVATIAANLLGSGALTKTDLGTLTLTGSNSYTGGTTVSAGILVGDTASLQGDVVNNASLVFDQASDGAYDGAVSGTGSLTKTGAATLTLAGANSHTGGTTISAGTLRLGASDVLADGGEVTVAGGALLDLAGFSETVGALNGAGNVDLGAGTLIVGEGAFDGGISGTGRLVKATEGTLVLTGANSYSGGTTISGGTLRIGAPERLANEGAVLVGVGAILDLESFSETVGDLNGDGRIFADGTLTVTGGGVFSGIVSGAGTLVKDGAEVLTLAGGNTYTGGTEIVAGTLRLGAAGVLADGGEVAVADGALLDLAGFSETVGALNGAGNIDLGAGTLTVGEGAFDGVITGAGSLAKAGDGTLVLSGNHSFAGGTSIAGGLLVASASGLPGDIHNEAQLIFDQALDDSYSGVLSGSGRFEKAGAGTLVMAGDSYAFNGTTEISAGALQVTGALGGAMAVLDGTVLGGSGTIGALTVVSGGIVAPGTSIGTLNVAGDAIFAAGSVFAVEVAADGTGDRIETAGSATIEGGTVAVTAIDPETAYQAGSIYTIVSAAGGVSGSFDGLTSNSAFLDFALGYDASSVFLTLSLARAFPEVAATFNQAQAATALTALDQAPGSDSVAVFNALLVLDEAEARAAFDAASGEIYGALLAATLRQGAVIADRLADQAYRAGGDGWNVWGGVTGHDGRIGADGNGARMSHDGIGAAFGIDYRGSANRYAIGIGGGYSGGDVALPARASFADQDGWHIGAYGRLGTGGAGFSGSASAALLRQQADVTRVVAFPGASRTARAAVDVNATALAFDLSYGFDGLGGGWAAGPAVSLGYTDVDLGRIEESGADSLALSGSGGSESWTRFGVGAFVNWQGRRGRVDAAAQYIRGGERLSEIPLSLAGAPAAPFRVRAAEGSRDAALLTISGDYALGRGWSIGGNLRALVSGAERSIAGAVTLGWRF